MWFVTLLLLIFILGIIILVHEFGHFITAKKSGVHIYEFSIGMGPIIKTHKGKDGIDYNLRAFPIGGFVSMAGEVYEDDETKKIPKDKFMCNKKWWQRIIILGAGVFNNFVLALVILFLMGIIWGVPDKRPVVGTIDNTYPIAETGIKENDIIIAIDGKNMSNWNDVITYTALKPKKDYFDVKVKHEDGSEKTYQVKYKSVEEQGVTRNKLGIASKVNNERSRGLGTSIKYAFTEFWETIKNMCSVLGNLFTGRLSLKALSGPVGIYHVVGENAKAGMEALVALIAMLSINVGLINILPIPAFDGGRIFFLIIEKIKGSPINAKFENMCHTIFFFLLIALMIYITVIDIIRFA